MNFHYAGKYSGDENDLPKRIHESNAVSFKEPSVKKLSIIGNVGGLCLMIILAIPFVVVGRKFFATNMYEIPIAAFAFLPSMIIHELLHAICFKNDVYLYHYISHGLLFVVGTEDMSKRRFIIMSMLPNIILGVIPYAIFFFVPRHIGFGMFGLIGIGSGFVDYLNVYNSITQMPKDSKTYLSGMHSYWYIPKKQK